MTQHVKAFKHYKCDSELRPGDVIWAAGRFWFFIGRPHPHQNLWLSFTGVHNEPARTDDSVDYNVVIR